MKRQRTLFAVSAFLILVPMSFVLGCEMYRFVKEVGMALENHVIETIITSNPSKCKSECVHMPQCFSVNMHFKENKLVKCELNNSSKAADPQQLQDRAESEYYQMADLDRCTATNCYHKEALSDGWFRYGSKLVKFFPEKKTWEQARQFCQSLSGEMVTIDSGHENEFISSLFRNNITDYKRSADILNCWHLDGSEDEDVILRNGATYKTDNETIAALYLDGNGSYVDTPAVTLQIPAFTITCWIKILEPAKTPGYIYADWSSPHQFAIWSDGDMKVLYVYLRNKEEMDMGRYDFYAGPTPYNVWLHVAVTWEEAQRLAKIFINGKDSASEIAPNDLSSYELLRNDHSHYQVGSKFDTGETFHGFVRELNVFKRILSDNEIQEAAELIVSEVWIGLNDISTDDKFVWSDGSSVKYTNWFQGQPEGRGSHSANEDCVTMRDARGINRGKWIVMSCDKQLHFVCQKNIF